MKGVLDDLLIIAAVFAILAASARTVSATPGFYWVAAMNNHWQSLYHSVRGNQTTNQCSVTHGNASEEDAVYSWIGIYHEQLGPEWMQVGYVKGWVPINNTDGQSGLVWLNTPYYYVDRWMNSQYNFTYFIPAPVGQNHEYWVYLYHWGTTTIMVALIDGKTYLAQAGFYDSACDAKGATESHNTRDQMNSYFFAMKAGTQWNNPVAFHDDDYQEIYNPPYSIFPYPRALTDTWITRGKGSP
jgi:hypothetical protein